MHFFLFFLFTIITYLQTKTKKSKKILNKQFASMKKMIKPTDSRMYVIVICMTIIYNTFTYPINVHRVYIMTKTVGYIIDTYYVCLEKKKKEQLSKKRKTRLKL